MKQLPPKEKAKEIIFKYKLIDREFRYQDELNLYEAKQCALLEIKGIRESWTMPIILTNRIKKSNWIEHINKLNDYWTQVENEINNYE